MIGTTILHFRIEQNLGAGGMGEVYLARDLKLDRQVALKFIRPELSNDSEARRRFEREARALAALNHPRVGAVYGVEESNGRLFMVLAYIEGRSLESLLAEGRLTPTRALTLLPRIAEGLQAAHRRGIVHRDMKSANIVVSSEDDLPQIVDFGIALRGDDTRLTQSGVYPGTVGFTAPEVYRGESADTRSDVFSLGVVFYGALTGHRPFERQNAAAALHAVLNEDPPPFARDLPPEVLALEPVVLRCLEKDPARRFPDAGGVVEALQPGTAPLSVPARSPSRPSSVAVLEFANVTREPSLDWMQRGVAELLSAALVKSPELDVFDTQRLGDLSAIEHSGTPPPAPTYAFLARHGIRRAIAGNILRSGADLMIQGRIVDTGDGRPIHSYAVEGRADSGLFHLVGRLIPDLQVALEVNLTGDREVEGWLREITTTSADAYRLYLRGHQAFLASHWKEAASAYEKALDLDSTFIAARTELSGVYWNLGDDAKLGLTRAAMQELRSRADHREQLRIDLLESVVGNDPPTTVRAATELAQLYPENRFYTYLLGRGYYFTQQYRRCLDTLRPLMEQRYKWAWTYVLSARSAVQLGDAATARRAFERGLEVTRDPELAYAYVQILLLWGDRDRSRAVIDEALQSPLLGESPMAEGELRLELAKDLIARGDEPRARPELERAAALLPMEDEARPELDSLLQRFGLM
jgi:serine/threonine-protein kinase